jgi:DDE family transposase
LLAIAYRYRWAVELFFRWVKCVLGCRHWLSQGINGVRIQVYAAFMASVLISLWVGRAPTKRTYEMLCFYLSGWATETEVVLENNNEHLTRLLAEGLSLFRALLSPRQEVVLASCHEAGPGEPGSAAVQSVRPSAG